MNDKETAKLQKVLLIISDEIDRICRKNGIRYTLYAGTLIGAVRHKGFIPWDDDFDIAMLREDYEKFISACKYDLKPEFGIININNSANYGYGFLKITLKGTRVLQGGFSKINEYSELWVDVFPIDNIPSKRLRQFIHKNEIYYLIKLLEERYDGIQVNCKRVLKVLFFRFLSIANSIIPANLEKKLLQNVSLKYNYRKTELVCSLHSPYSYYSEILNREVFDHFIELDFEGRKYLAVSEYDKWLSQVYGDYMKLPPVEKRNTHSFIDYDLGVYNI